MVLLPPLLREPSSRASPNILLHQGWSTPLLRNVSLKRASGSCSLQLTRVPGHFQPRRHSKANTKRKQSRSAKLIWVSPPSSVHRSVASNCTGYRPPRLLFDPLARDITAVLFICPGDLVQDLWIVFCFLGCLIVNHLMVVEFEEMVLSNFELKNKTEYNCPST